VGKLRSAIIVEVTISGYPDHYRWTRIASPNIRQRLRLVEDDEKRRAKNVREGSAPKGSTYRSYTRREGTACGQHHVQPPLLVYDWGEEAEDRGQTIFNSVKDLVILHKILSKQTFQSMGIQLIRTHS